VGEYWTDHDFFELWGTPAKRPICDSFDTEKNAYPYDGLGRFPSHTVDVAPAVSYGYIRGKQHCLYRAVDQDGDVIDILVQKRRNTRAAVRFFRKLMNGQGGSPRRLVTDKLKSYPAAHRQLMSGAIYVTDRYANNRAEVSHESTRQQKDDALI
jgi:hypothetical protein